MLERHGNIEPLLKFQDLNHKTWNQKNDFKSSYFPCCLHAALDAFDTKLNSEENFKNKY